MLMFDENEREWFWTTEEKYYSVKRNDLVVFKGGSRSYFLSNARYAKACSIESQLRVWYVWILTEARNWPEILNKLLVIEWSINLKWCRWIFDLHQFSCYAIGINFFACNSKAVRLSQPLWGCKIHFPVEFIFEAFE